MKKLKVLDLFSGIGGFSLGLERTGGFETVAFCEIEPFPCKVLKKHWPEVPIYNDVRELTNEKLKADGITGIDVITGGFPCQDISVAGKQAGIDGERSGLWSELARIISDVQPRYAILENVTALISGDSGRWFGRVLGDLAEIGYDAEWHCIPASELGAKHRRDRIWIIAYPVRGRDRHSKTLDQSSLDKERNTEAYRQGWSTVTSKVRGNDTLANTNCAGLQGSQEFGIFGKGGERWHKLITRCFRGFENISQVEPTVCRDSYGVSNYTHRLKGLGNAVVPQIPELIGRAILDSI